MVLLTPYSLRPNIRKVLNSQAYSDGYTRLVTSTQNPAIMNFAWKNSRNGGDDLNCLEMEGAINIVNGNIMLQNLR